MFSGQLLRIVVLILFLQFILSDDDQLARYFKTKCRNDGACKENSFCYGNDNGVLGYCKCKTGFEMYVDDRYYECVKDAKLGETCRRSLQCQISAGPLAICNGYNTDGICVCNSTISHEVAGECYETKYLNDFCRVDQNCLLPENPIWEDKLALCYYGVCSCRLGKRPAKNNKSCIENRNMDEKCEDDSQCQMTENAVCRTICLCETGFTRSKDGKQCLRAALKFGEPCIENEQCSRYLENAVCKSNVCACPDKYHGYETRCRKDVKPDEVCFDDAECIISKDLLRKVNCTKGICTCTYGKSYDDNLCLSDAPYSTDQQNGLLVLSFLIAVFIKFV